MSRLLRAAAALFILCAIAMTGGCGPTGAWMKADGLFKSEKYKQAAGAYTEAAKQYPDRPELVFNAGASQYMAEDFEQARRTFQKVARDASVELKEKAEFNTGNTCMAQQETEAAVEHYKRALYLKPDDKRAKWNLEMAQRKQKQKRQKQQKQQNDKKQKKNDQQKQDRGEKNKKDQDRPKRKEKSQNEQQEEKEKQGQKQRQTQQERQKQKRKLSEEEARRLLRAMAEEDKKLQKRLRKPKYRSRTAPAGKDW